MSQLQHFDLPSTFRLESGKSLFNPSIAYQTFGTFEEGKKVIWVCHALTANTDVLDWWPGLFGADALFSPEDHFIVCANILGSSYGSTSPESLDENGNHYMKNFPLITTRDIAKSFNLLRLNLSIESIDLLIGASLGGQQAQEWLILEPTLVKKAVLIATNARHSAFGIAFNESQRLALIADPSFDGVNPNGGQNGLITARSIALLSYRSYDGYSKTQTHSDLEQLEDFPAATYQKYQGEKLAKRFNAYSYWSLTRTMDAHNVGRNREGVQLALKQIQTPTLIVGITTDLLFPLKEQLFLSNHIPQSTFQTIFSDFGHDGFLVEGHQLQCVLKKFLPELVAPLIAN
jgi:homoserine O-acetyltransferase/O-succinyltransferase